MKNYGSDSTANTISVTLHKARQVILTRPWCMEKMKNPYTRIYFVKRGTGTLSWNDKVIPIADNTIYVIPAELEFSAESSFFEKLYFHISVLTKAQQDVYASLDQIYSFPCSDAEYETVRTCLFSNSYYDKVKLEMLLFGVLDKLAQSFTLPVSEVLKYSEFTSKILTYIQNHLSIQLKVSDIASALFVSESKVRDAFRKELNMPIGAYIDDLVFAKARQLLELPGASIADVSAMLGFCDQFYFSRQFSKKFGQTPSQFRIMT